MRLTAYSQDINPIKIFDKTLIFIYFQEHIKHI